MNDRTRTQRITATDIVPREAESAVWWRALAEAYGCWDGRTADRDYATERPRQSHLAHLNRVDAHQSRHRVTVDSDRQTGARDEPVAMDAACGSPFARWVCCYG